MAVSKRLRYEVMRRDDHACRYCGAKAPDVKLTVDHVIPVALGGPDKPENLVTACTDCNAGKSSSSPDAPIVANVADDALRWARAIAAAAQMQALQRDRFHAYRDAINSAWERWTWTSRTLVDGVWQETTLHIPRPDDWAESLGRFHSLGLELDVAVEAVSTAMNQGGDVGVEDTWRYFCGVCWRILKERQQIAREMIDDGEF